MVSREEYFRGVDFLRRRKRGYQLAFSDPTGQEVLADLAKFCRAFETCFDPDARLHAVAEGRREVWLRIERHLKLTPEQLAQLYGIVVDRQPFNPLGPEQGDAS